MKRRSISHTVRITSGLQEVLTQEKQDGESYGATIERLVAESRPDMEAQGNPGRGKRFCPVCNRSVGIRTKTCECGTELDQLPSHHRRLKCEALEDRRMLSVDVNLPEMSLMNDSFNFGKQVVFIDNKPGLQLYNATNQPPEIISFEVDFDATDQNPFTSVIVCGLDYP